MPRDAGRQNWLKTNFMKKYMADWGANAGRSRAAEMRANALKQYPGLGMEFTLNDRVATYFPAQPAGNT